MATKEIRLQYAGFIIFAAKMLSVATGLIFTLLITRNTSRSEYGIWTNAFDLLAYFVLLAATIPFWSTRFVARNKEGATKTGIVTNLIIGMISIVFYIPLVPFITSALNVGSYVAFYYLVSAQIVESYLINQLEATLRAERPQAVGYGLLVEEITKVALAYVLIVILKQPLIGAMISLTVAIMIQIIYYLKLIAPSLKEETQWNYVREWLKGSIAGIYFLIGNQLANVIFIMLFVYGGSAARGEYGAASIIASIAGYSSFLYFAMYPRLLANKSLEDVKTSLKLLLMFAIPMVAGAFAIPDSLLTILSPDYAEAVPVVIILAIDVLISTTSGLYRDVLFGVEKLDEKSTIPTRQLVKSNIFKVYTLSYVHSAVTLPLAYYFLTNFASQQPLQAAIYVAAITMMTRLAMFIVLLLLVRKAVKVVVPWRSIGKYVLAGAIMGFVLYMIPHTGKLATTLATAVAGGIIYLVLLAAIDKEARTLIKSILHEIEERVT